MRSKLIVLLSMLSLFSENGVAANGKITSFAELNNRIDGRIRVVMPWSKPVPVKGHLQAGKVDSEGRSVGYFYDPQLGAAGPALQLFAQMVASSSARDKKFAEHQEEADRVLSEHNENLTTISHRRLYELFEQQASEVGYRKHLLSDGEKDSAYFVRLLPEFIVSQDLRSIKIEVVAELRKKQKMRKKPILTRRFTVVSDPMSAELVESFWSAQNPNELMTSFESLFQDSVYLILSAFTEPLSVSSNEQTFRYEYGGNTSFERATEISVKHAKSTCDRVILLTLGDGLMSIPLSKNDCL